MSRYVTDSWVTGSIGAHTASVINRTVIANAINIFKIKVVPSVAGATTEVRVFKKATALSADLVYATLPFTGSLIDPIEDDGGGVTAERNEGFLFPYEDLDSSLALHLQITNDYSSALTYTVTITYEVAASSASGLSVPGNLVADATSSGLKVTSIVKAGTNNSTIFQGEFRALFVAAGGAIPGSVDMRTVAEGGTFVPDGITKLLVTGIAAASGGAQYFFTSAASGRWFYAWRLENTIGQSNWSNGNVDTGWVNQYVDTNVAATANSGPPSGWQVTLEYGPTTGTVVVHATRPQTNGKVLQNWAVQIKDGASGSWRALDANAGAAVTRYDGSAIDHVISDGNLIITRSSGSGFGTAADGDLVLIDVRGGTYAVAYTTGAIVKSVDAGGTFITLYGAPNPLPLVTTGLRLRIVKSPWLWNSEGYLGAEANHGYWDSTMPGAQSIFGDQNTAEFTSQPIDIPNSVVQPEARVIFTNDYSANDDTVNHSTGINGPGILTSATWTNFADQNTWVLIRGIPACATYTLLQTGLTITGAEAFDGAKTRANFLGVVSRGLFFPDVTDGELHLKVTMDSLVNPSDMDTSNRIFAYGISLMGQSFDDAFEYPTALFGKIGAASKLYSELYNYTPGGGFTVKASLGSDTVVNGGSVTIDITLGIAATTATENAMGVKTLAFGGSVSHTSTPAANSPITVCQTMNGIRVALGMFQQHLTAVGSMRITKLELLKGRYISN